MTEAIWVAIIIQSGGVVVAAIAGARKLGAIGRDTKATRGDFTDYQGRTTLADHPNWEFHAIEGGALPYFENLHAFTEPLDRFWKARG